MDTNGRRGLSRVYILAKIVLLVAIVGKATITSEIFALRKDFTPIIVYSLSLLITFICSYLIFDISLEMYLLNTLQRSGICSRYLLQLSVQQLYRCPFPELPQLIKFLKEISYVVTTATSINVLLNYITVQNKWFENYIQRFVILAIILVATMSLEFIGQYEGTFLRLLATIIILTIYTGVSMSFTRLFWSSVYCSIFIAVHISVNQLKDYVLCCINKESSGNPQHIVEENKRERTSKRCLNKESGDAPFQKEGIVNELLEPAKVSDVNEEEYHMDKENFKRKRNLFEMGHESLKNVIREPTIKKLKTKSLSLNNADKIHFERMCCEQKQPSKNLGFPFEHCVHSKMNLTFGIDSIDSNVDDVLNKQVEQITNRVLKPADVIKESDFQPELVFHEEMEILTQQTLQKIGNIVSDCVQFYESSHKECQSEGSVKNGSSDDKSPCKYSADFEMSEKVEHKSVQQVDTVSNDAIEKNVQTWPNLSSADVKTDFFKIENTCLHEAKIDFDRTQIAENDFRYDNLNFKKHDLSTDNAVNEIDLRFTYSVY